jgi:hypothetical protein
VECARYAGGCSHLRVAPKAACSLRPFDADARRSSGSAGADRENVSLTGAGHRCSHRTSRRKRTVVYLAGGARQPARGDEIDRWRARRRRHSMSERPNIPSCSRLFSPDGATSSSARLPVARRARRVGPSTAPTRLAVARVDARTTTRSIPCWSRDARVRGCCIFNRSYRRGGRVLHLSVLARSERPDDHALWRSTAVCAIINGVHPARGG